MRSLILAAAFLALAAPAWAQTVISVDINKANFSFTWTQGMGGPATEWWWECGPTTGAPGAVPFKISYVAPASGTTYTQPVKPVVGGVGKYFCTVRASNQFGQSTKSNEVSFDAGQVPSAPTGLVIQAQ